MQVQMLVISVLILGSLGLPFPVSSVSLGVCIFQRWVRPWRRMAVWVWPFMASKQAVTFQIFIGLGANFTLAIGQGKEMSLLIKAVGGNIICYKSRGLSGRTS